jgi:hypothetical protein
MIGGKRLKIGRKGEIHTQRVEQNRSAMVFIKPKSPFAALKARQMFPACYTAWAVLKRQRFFQDPNSKSPMFSDKALSY